MTTMDIAETVDLRAIDIPVGSATSASGPLKVAPLEVAGHTYSYSPSRPAARLDIVRTLRAGWHLRVRSQCTLSGPCWRCLGEAQAPLDIDATEVHDASGEDPDLTCGYVEEGVLDVAGWLRDAIAEAMPSRFVCREDCKGMCSRCGADLNEGPCDCGPPEPDPRWGPLADLARRLEEGTG